MRLKAIWILTVIIPAITGVLLCIVAWQSVGLLGVIDESLARHVAQRLIDRATHAIVMNTANVQNLWLWLAALTLEVTAMASAWSLLRQR